MISCGAEVIARHPRSYEREDFVFDPLHYLALIEQKICPLRERRRSQIDAPGALRCIPLAMEIALRKVAGVHPCQKKLNGIKLSFQYPFIWGVLV